VCRWWKAHRGDYAKIYVGCQNFSHHYKLHQHANNDNNGTVLVATVRITAKHG